jgi:hypothetical protein
MLAKQISIVYILLALVSGLCVAEYKPYTGKKLLINYMD